ncbi:PKD domain-containing protein, partial [Polaribacter sp.]|uniref:PKD domain-containing protein n=1 Tax=Polaribacter sp. TaxID=1920175 RepID=UPI00404838F2
SAVSSVKINEAPVITSQPQSSEVCLGENATTLEVAYQNGVGIATHQWFFTSINSNTGGTAIIGATNTSYIPPTNAIGTIYYYVEINFTDGGCSKIVSDVATVIVNQIPVIANDSITIYSSETFTYNPSILNGNIVPNNTQYTWIVSSINQAGSIIGSSNAISPQNIINQTLENTGTTPARVTYTISPFTDKCKGSDFTLEVVVNPTITPNEVITNNSCFNSNDASITTNIIGGIPFESGKPYLINWTGPNGFLSTDSSIFNLVAGSYTLRIEDKEGYFITRNFTITQPDNLIINTDSTKNISCFQGNDGSIKVTVSGGTTPYTYNWTTLNGSGLVQNTNSQNGLTAGNYTLEVIDKNNCSTTIDFVLTEPDGLEISAQNIENVLCFGEAIGSISINVIGGTPFEISTDIFDYQYAWSGPNGFTSFNKNIANLISGNYLVEVTDQQGCVTNATFTVTEATKIEPIVTKNDVSCYGETDGSIAISVTGGVAPYQIQWSNLANGFSLNNLSAGTYIATITDANNCESKVTIDINQPIFFIDPIVTPISCNGEKDGSIKLNLTGGIAPYTVLWDDDPSTGIERNNLGAGTYRVLIKDSDPKQCPIEQTFIFTEPPALVVSSTVVDATECDVIDSGSIDLIVAGGTAPYFYKWSNGQTTANVSNLTAGNYAVEITDSNGCKTTRQFSIFRQEPLQIEFETILLTNCETKIVSQQTKAKVTGGFLPYTYTWSDGTVSTSDNSIMTTSQNGSYTLLITDNQGCTIQKSFAVSVPSIGTPDFQFSAFSQNTYNFLSVEDPIQFTNTSTGNFTKVIWDFGDGKPTSNEENPIYTYDNVGEFTVRLTVEYEAGCTYFIERLVKITLGYTLINPNAFTPNGDGFNETIRPSFLGFSSIEMSIFDIWGTLVYTEKGTTTLNGWDGNVKGKPAENGNYVMIVKGTTFYGKEISANTSITLIK